MANKNIVFNHTLEQYYKKYRNRREHLLKVSKKEVEDYDKKYGHYVHKGEINSLDFNNYLLENRKWWFIKEDNCYHEIPRPIRFSWFRNLKLSIQIATYGVLSAGIACAVVFPVLEATKINYNVTVNKEVEKYVDIDVGKIEVGKPLKTEFTLKDTAKETKQLPKKLKVVKTGDVILPEYNKLATISKNIIQNEVEPENYYTYTLISKDKADLYIKKVIGPISVELDIEERKYTVTFDPNNGQDKQIVEVIKNNKVNKPADPKKDLCALNYWSLENSNEPFNFDTLINEDITLKAHWIASETGVIIRGINGLANHYSTMEEAFNAGLGVMKTISNNDLAHGKCNKEDFLNTFNDIKVDDEGNSYASLTWELYTKEGEKLEVPYGSGDNSYFYSMGRKSCGIGLNDDLFIAGINVVSGTENKAALKLNVTNLQRTLQKNMNIKNSQRNDISNPYSFKNIAFDDSLVNNGNFISSETSEVPYKFILNYDSCTFVNRMYIEGGNLDITVNNCTFDGANSTQKYCFYYVGSNLQKVDTIKFTNNTIKNYRRGVQLNGYSAKYVLVENNTFKDLNANSLEKCGVGALQFSASYQTVFDVKNNKFSNCKSNCFLVHEICDDGAIININDNIIENCGYVGCSEPNISTRLYTLNSSNNIIKNTTKDKCGFDTQVSVDQEHILTINEKQ